MDVIHNIEVRRRRRPPERKDKSQELVDILYPAAVVSKKKKRKCRKRKSKVKPSLRLALQDLVENVDLCEPDERAYIHWCYVEAGSEAQKQGLRVGSACCKDTGESIQKVQVPVMNWNANRGWDAQADGRWTFLVAQLKKFCIGNAAKKSLTNALRDVKTHWELSDELEAALARQVAADKNDFSSKSKLRLLRVVNVLCSSAAEWQMPCMLTGLMAIDASQTKILVDRVPLTEVVDLIAESQDLLLNYLEHWDSGRWRLLWLLCGDTVFEKDEVKLWSRGYILQLYASQYDHFERRFGDPPYSLLALPKPAVSMAKKDDRITDFFSRPQHCLSMFCRRLRAQHPTRAAMKTTGSACIEAFGGATWHCIDVSERSHNQVCTDLRSDGRARSVTASCNRVFCKEAYGVWAAQWNLIK